MAEDPDKLTPEQKLVASYIENKLLEYVAKRGIPMPFYTNGSKITEEAQELRDALVTYLAKPTDNNRKALKEEVADVVITAAVAARQAKFTVEEALDAKIFKDTNRGVKMPKEDDAISQLPEFIRKIANKELAVTSILDLVAKEAGKYFTPANTSSEKDTPAWKSVTDPVYSPEKGKNSATVDNNSVVSVYPACPNCNDSLTPSFEGNDDSSFFWDCNTCGNEYSPTMLRIAEHRAAARAPKENVPNAIFEVGKTYSFTYEDKDYMGRVLTVGTGKHGIEVDFGLDDGRLLSTPQAFISNAEEIVFASPASKFTVGDQVRKVSGYKFDSTIVSVFEKLDGTVRVVAEDDRGILHIFNEDQLEKISTPTSIRVNERKS